MAKKIIAISDGHNINTDGKRTPKYQKPYPDSYYDDGYIRENEFNHPTKEFLKLEINRQTNMQALDVSPERIGTTLEERVQRTNTNNADIFIAIHYNALNSTWRTNTINDGGIETFHYPGSVNGQKLANKVHAQLIKGTVFKDRGIKSADFYVLHYTNCPAILCECGFMDVLREANLMLEMQYQKECAVEICKGICDYFNVKYVAEQNTKNWLTILKETSQYWHVWEDFVNTHQNQVNLKGLIEKLYYIIPK